VSAYENEQAINTTLIEGSVKVHAGEQTAVLTPGQQAQVGATINVTNNIDSNQVTAWKNGLFNFEDANLEEVMRQVSRWYDIKIIYEKGIPDIQLWGKMSRNTNLSGLLKNLKDVGVRFKANEEKKELIILP